VARLAIARRLIAAELQHVQRRLSRQWRAVAPPRLQLAGQRRQNRIVPELIMGVQILMAKRNADQQFSF
jgi:hypothetical protein